MDHVQLPEPSSIRQSTLTGSELLALLPQQRPFRFVDEILEIDGKHVIASYRFRENEAFYSGHFPDRPVTPGVVLLEAMAQCGVVIHSLYLLALAASTEEAARYRTLVTGAEVEWLEPVYPGTAVVMHSDLLAWRSRRIRVQVKMHDSKNTLLAQSTISGLGVLWNQEQFAPLDGTHRGTISEPVTTRGHANRGVRK